FPGPFDHLMQPAHLPVRVVASGGVEERIDHRQKGAKPLCQLRVGEQIIEHSLAIRDHLRIARQSSEKVLNFSLMSAVRCKSRQDIIESQDMRGSRAQLKKFTLSIQGSRWSLRVE